jgi:2-amino-4-hydroxy-6-hydroxymethyldihydropteridine diphosphokinase
VTQSYIGLGSNLGNSIKNVEEAVKQITRFAHIIAVSSLFKTKPWGVTEQPDFVNAVVSIETALTAEELLSELLAIEKRMGRERITKWGPREIDLDILTFGDRKFDISKLTIPHPHMFERAFVLVPLAEIDRNFETALQKLPAEDVSSVERLREKIDIW